ncbi:MAG TPA: phosphodiester glycosidase family protein [Rhizomicrobium sp.]|nr:phosphodiester glycosidase family protein [Rhizomicrobium sp.]
MALVASDPALADPACEARTFEGDGFTVCAFDSRTETLRLAWTDSRGIALRSFDRLAKNLGSLTGNVRFAMNAGMFDSAGTPIGLYVENGILRRHLNTDTGSGNFYMKPNGVFWLDADGTVHVEPTGKFPFRSTTPDWATQSGPMLVIDNAFNPQIAADGSSRYIRNAVGVRDAYHAVFVISDAPVSFGRLVRFLRDGLHCPDALYLDGAVSSLWNPSSGRQDEKSRLGPMVVVSNKN